MTWSHSNFVTAFPIYDFDFKKTKKLFFTNLHILGVRKTFEKLEKEMIKAFENPKEEGKKEVTEAGFRNDARVFREHDLIGRELILVQCMYT